MKILMITIFVLFVILVLFLLFVACLGASDMARSEEQWEIERLLNDEKRKSNKSKK